MWADQPYLTIWTCGLPGSSTHHQESAPTLLPTWTWILCCLCWPCKSLWHCPSQTPVPHSRKYGLPPIIIQNVEKLYNNCKVKIKVGKGYTKVDYTTGVQQGDNMSPILFLGLPWHAAYRCPTHPIFVLPRKQKWKPCDLQRKTPRPKHHSQGYAFQLSFLFLRGWQFLHFLKQIWTIPCPNKTWYTLRAFWAEHSCRLPHN